MSLKSFLKLFFLGEEILEKAHSPINGELLVYRDLFGRKILRAGRVTQSGVLVDRLWKRGLKAIDNLEIKNCLILGLGGGTLAKLISKKYKKAKITGIEIDSEIIKLGKKYFEIDKIKNLKIILDDAFQATGKLSVNNFDLIFVDLYIGQEFPKKAEEKEFFDNLKKLITPNGAIIFNRLNFNKEHKKMTKEFEKKIRAFFPRVESLNVVYNRLFFAFLEPKNRV